MSTNERGGDLALSLGIAAGLWMGSNALTGPLSGWTCVIAGLVVYGGAQILGLAVNLAVNALYALFPSLFPWRAKP